MKRVIALFLALLLTAVPLAGCTGDDDSVSLPDQEWYENKIHDLEAQAEEDQVIIAEIGALQEQVEYYHEEGIDYEAAQARLQEDIDEAYETGYSDGSTLGGYNTLDTILDRGEMWCGVKDSQFGMGYLNADGTYSGLDIEYCKAVAAAIGLNPETDVVYKLATGSNRFDLLASGEIDVLIRTTTWTTSRDADLNADFAGMNFFDGQGILVNTDAYNETPTSALDLDGANICVGIGTTTEGNIADYFAVNGMTYTAVNSDNAGAAKASFEAGECDAWTGDMSAMVAQKWGLDTTAVPNSAIMPELLSKEPLGAATRDNDDDWNDVVAWVWYGMITAEEYGLTMANHGAADMTIPANDRLLAQNLGLGTEDNPLPSDWMGRVLDAVGNYGEAYDRSFCDGDGTHSNCLIDRAGTANDLAGNGGLQFAPPMR